MINHPRVSVIMNCYNGAGYLTQAIESVIQQTYPNWELIFWDNLSTDLSANIVSGFQESRIKYFLSGGHTQLSEARNAAINASSGKPIASESTRPLIASATNNFLVVLLKPYFSSITNVE